MNDELEKYLKPALQWLDRRLIDQKTKGAEKKKLILLREFIKEQLPNENIDRSTR
jgi:hypothetical protein